MLSRQILGVILAVTLVAGTLGMLASLTAYVASSSTEGTVLQSQPIQLGPVAGLQKGPARLVP